MVPETAISSQSGLYTVSTWHEELWLATSQWHQAAIDCVKAFNEKIQSYERDESMLYASPQDAYFGRGKLEELYPLEVTTHEPN